jgi:hypothetical protein
MPLYNGKNKNHKKIMQLARKATLLKPTDKIYIDLQESYLKLCNEF